MKNFHGSSKYNTKHWLVIGYWQNENKCLEDFADEAAKSHIY